MATAFEFATATRIVCGPGALSAVGPAAASIGGPALVVTGRDRERVRPLLAMLDERGVGCERVAVAGEPTVMSVRRVCDMARELGCQLVIGFGGGSAIDIAKAVAALIANPGDLLDYLEVVGRGAKLTARSIPCITVPTTAGTGAEVTRNSVIAVPEQRVKASLRSAHMLPDLAVVDSKLTYELPPPITANTGLDALSQLIEPYVSFTSNPLVDPLCREGIRLVARSLEPAFTSGDRRARDELSRAALFSGLALANAKLGAVHGIAGPLGGMFDRAPHGAVCGRLLGPVIRSNVHALEQRQPISPALVRYTEVARLLTGSPTATAGDGAKWVDELCARLQVPGLAAYDVGQSDFLELVEKSRRASSMKGNPVELTDSELTEILQAAL